VPLGRSPASPTSGARVYAGKLATNGSVVLERDSNLLAFGAILRHRHPLDQDEEVGEGGRTAAAINASQFDAVLMVSEGGRLSFHQKGHCVWTL
jgi:hypothetical protein